MLRGGGCGSYGVFPKWASCCRTKAGDLSSISAVYCSLLCSMICSLARFTATIAMFAVLNVIGLSSYYRVVQCAAILACVKH